MLQSMVKIDFQSWQIEEAGGEGGHAPSSYMNTAILVLFSLLDNVVFLYIFYSYYEVFTACYCSVILLLVLFIQET